MRNERQLSIVAADELAGYCLHALTAAGALPTHDGIPRLVAVTLAGLRPPKTGTNPP